MEVDNNVETLDESAQLTDASVETSVQDVSADTMSLTELNNYLGKDFKDKSTALKALKDTFSYVGKKKDDIIREVKSSEDLTKVYKELSDLKKNAFYDKNPQFAEQRALIDKLGSNPEEVVNSNEFKGMFEKVKGYDENQKLKKVMETNPRLSSSRDALSRATESVLKSGTPSEEVENLVAGAIRDAYGM